MATITWKDTASGYGGQEALLMKAGADMVSTGLGGAKTLIGELGAIAKGQELRKKDVIAQGYVTQQQDAEQELMDFLRQNQGNPLLSSRGINPVTGELELIDRETYLKNRVSTDLKLNYDDLSEVDKKVLAEPLAKEYDKAAASMDSLDTEYKRLTSQLDNTRNLQRNIRDIYATGNNWLDTAEIENRTAAFSTGFGGSVDKEAALAAKTTQENLLANETNFDLSEASLQQEGLKNDKQRLTIDYTPFAESTKGENIQSITANFRNNIGKYAGFADSVTQLALQKFQETGEEWDSGRAEEIANGAENAFSKLEAELTAQSQSKNPEIAARAAEKKAHLLKYKNMLWIQTLAAEKTSGGDLDKTFDMGWRIWELGEGNTETIGDYFKLKLDGNLEKVVNNELMKKDYDAKINAWEKTKKNIRDSQYMRQSQIDQSFQAKVTQPAFRDLVTKIR